MKARQTDALARVVPLKRASDLKSRQDLLCFLNATRASLIQCRDIISQAPPGLVEQAILTSGRDAEQVKADLRELNRLIRDMGDQYE